MPLNCYVEALEFPSGEAERIEPGSITVFVGPNNSGKSTVLRDIAGLLTHGASTPSFRPVALRDLQLTKACTADDVCQWLVEQGWEGRLDAQLFGGEPYFGARGANPLSRADAVAAWQNAGLGRLTEFLVGVQLTDNRLQLLGGTQVHDQRSDIARHPLQKLYSDTALEERLNRLINRAFGMTLSINRYVSQIDLLVGSPTEPLSPPPASAALLDEYAGLPFLNQEGDGVRSFAGLLLQALVLDLPFLLIDEPEAFLHPPQARLLGRMLADETPSDAQVFVASHSQDFLQGVVESSARAVKIVRLTRSGANTVRRQSLEPDHLKTLWNDALIRYSQLLDGIFHTALIVCESDADCRFYEAVADGIQGGAVELDIEFTHVGGKARLRKAAETMREFGVPVALVADLDLLNDRELTRQTLESVGCEWTAVEALYDQVSTAVQQTRRRPRAADVRESWQAIVGEEGGEAELSARQIQALKASLSSPSEWRELKRVGLSGLSDQGGREALARLVSVAAEYGLFLVPVGELEGWFPEVSGKSGWWVSQVLEQGHHNVPTDELRDFVSQIVRWCTSATSAPESGRARL